MTQTLEAVFEQGVFRPLNPRNLAIVEGQHVQLVVATAEVPADILELATQVYDGLSKSQIDEIEQIILDRRHFFTDQAIVP